MDPYQSPQLDPRSDDAAPLLATPTDERLQIEHYVLFGGGVTIAAWCDRTIYEALTVPMLSLFFGRYGLQVMLQVLLQGAGIASLGLLALRRYQRRKTFPTQFGHWLLLFQGALCLTEHLYWIVHRHFLWSKAYEADGWTQSIDVELYLAVLFVLIYAAVAAIPMLAAIYSQGQPSWQFCAIALAINTGWLAARPFFGKDEGAIWMGGVILTGGVAMLAFCLATVRDLIKPAGKDQLHWVGLACHFGLTIAMRVFRFL